MTATLAGWQSGLLAEQNRSARTAAVERGLAGFENYVFEGYYRVHQKTVRVLLYTHELAEEIGPRLDALRWPQSKADFTFVVTEAPDGFHLFCGGACFATEEDISVARTLLLQEIVRTCRGRDCLAVFHAGACGFNSQCVLFPAVTQSGKTTLAAVLMKAGLNLYSDDSALLECDTLSVPAMPFALMIREGSWAELGSRFPELENSPIVSRFDQKIRFLPPTGIPQNGHSAKAAAILFVHFKLQAGNQLSRLDCLQTLLRLQESGFWVAHNQQSIRNFLDWLQSTPSFSLTYSDVDHAAAVFRQILAAT